MKRPQQHKPTRRLAWLRFLPALAFTLTVDSWGGAAPRAHEIAPNGFEVRRVAHAGGGVEQDAYTNSLEALNLNYARGFRYFEIDFSWTRDNELVCLHDWGAAFYRAFGQRPTGPVSLEEFTQLISQSSTYEKCTLESLITWLEYHPDAKLVTDVKRDNIAALTKIAARLDNAAERVIPQIYQPAEFSDIKALGFAQFIWTLYRFDGDNEDVLNTVRHFDLPFAVTMTTRRVGEQLPEALAKLGIPSYTHTINSEHEVLAYRERYDVSEIYTDFLPVD